MRLQTLLLTLLLVGASASAQTTYEVRQESAPNANDFDSQPSLGTVTPYDGTSQTVAAYYNRSSGAPFTYQGPAPLYSAIANDKAVLFLVETSEGLALMNVIRAGQGNTLWSTTTSGPFTSLALEDDPDNAADTFTFANGTLTASGQIGATYGDGSVLLVERNSPEPIFFSLDSGTQGLSGANAGIQVFGPDGSGGNTVIPASITNGRRVRLAPTQLSIGAGPPSDAPGWRLLSAPVSGLSVLDLAQINYVGGVPAGDVNAAQYPGAGYTNARGQLAGNLFHAYEGVASIRNQAGTADSVAVIYAPVPSTDYTFESGRGLWWYWYDAAFDLEQTRGGGIGVSYELTDADFALRASGLPVTSDVTASFPLATVLPLTFDGDGDGNPDAEVPQDYFYMGGNPFAQPFNVDGISASGGTVQQLVYTWDPTALDGAGNHVPLARSATPTPTSNAGANAAVWQGLLIEVTPDGTAGPTLTYAATSADGGAAATFYGKGGSAPEAIQEFALTLSGEGTEDKAWLRFQPYATDGWDAADGSKYSLAPAQIAFSTPEGKRLGMSALDDGTAAPLARRVRVRMSFTAKEAGTYTLAWDRTLARGWGATLFDRVTRRRVNMRRNASYTFQSDAMDWSERFEIRVRPAKGAATAKTSGEDEPVVGTPYPNPASGASRIEVAVGEAQDVRVSIYDALGREVGVAHEGTLAAGSHVVTLPVESLSAGTYIVRVTGGDVAETRRLTVVR
ncbi:T9SS type A sorting domain-containing protein [Rubricoccus marinus]|uniref:Secretion system C-terminal sorting domain-containing protein n=1 Tax=Rubricoccus marinus TaxID=716817 RepID=A0A259TW39_9BACT|nr:T9SS type A sorting domain-containing protein [Rubricoccus marinus]OZC01768.1 hypothetical protein BSZ36_01450 [Rubricoccus marinus]